MSLDRMEHRSLEKRLWYDVLHVICRVVGAAIYRIRCFGREHEPAQGGALVLANHQSHFDPMLVGLACRRRLNYVARETLFRFLLFRWLIGSLDAIPIDREGLGLSGLKKTLRRLKRGEMVLIFPEGTRTFDGEIGPIKPGFCAVARRAGVPLLPVGIDGAFQAWPRGQTFPRGGAIHVCLGPSLTPDDIARLSDEQLVAEISRRLRDCLNHARQTRHRAMSSE